jgi:hypothetical protein
MDVINCWRGFAVGLILLWGFSVRKHQVDRDGIRPMSRFVQEFAFYPFKLIILGIAARRFIRLSFDLREF